MRNLIHNTIAILMNAAVGALVALYFGVTPLVGALATNLFMFGLALIKFYYTGMPIMFRGMAFAGLLKEIWIGKLMEKFYPDGSFLLESVDMSEFVNNNTIHLADAGIDPVVLINNTTYPVPMSERTDTPIELPLDYYDTENTVVRNATSVQLAYNKLESVVRGHRNAIYTVNVKKAAHAYGPASNTTFTPVIAIADSIIDAFIDAEAKFDALDVPKEGRISVLCPVHKALLKKEDKKLFKEIFGTNGTRELYGFKLYDTSVTPTYNGTTGVKKAYGTAPAGTDAVSSLFYSKFEVMRCDGTYDMFSRLKDPEARGDVVGFQKRFLAMPIRGKYTGAIIGNALVPTP